MSQLPPRNPNEGFLFMIIGLIFWTAVLIAAPTLVHHASSWL